MENTFIINKVDKNIAYIYSKENNIYIEFYKHRKFIEIMKKYSYSWNGFIWTKDMNRFTPSVDDMMAEIGLKLLEHQINIKVQNDKVYEMIKNKDFEPECFRWIVTTKNDSNLIFYIRNPDNSIGKSIKKITGIKYEKGFFNTKINNFEEVFEFANKHNFKISEEVLKKVNVFEKEFMREYTKKF